MVGYTQRDLDNWANTVARSIRAAGGKPGDTVHVAYGYGLFTGGLGRITAPNAWVAPSSRCRAGRPKSRCS